MSTLIVALRVTVLTLLLTGIAYPLAMTGIAQVMFPARANGSLVKDEHGAVVGSELIAQPFANPGYFQPRPSANAYDGLSSGGSNLGRSSPKLKERTAADVARLKRENAGEPPLELVTASASGLDPHISPESALWQVARVARARGVAEERVRVVVNGNIEGRDLMFMGEPRVNVLLVNLALDKQFGRPPAVPAAEAAPAPDAGAAEATGPAVVAP